MSWFRHRPIPHEPSKLAPTQPILETELPTHVKEVKLPVKSKKKK